MLRECRILSDWLSRPIDIPYIYIRISLAAYTEIWRYQYVDTRTFYFLVLYSSIIYTTEDVYPDAGSIIYSCAVSSEPDWLFRVLIVRQESSITRSSTLYRKNTYRKIGTTWDIYLVWWTEEEVERSLRVYISILLIWQLYINVVTRIVGSLLVYYYISYIKPYFLLDVSIIKDDSNLYTPDLIINHLLYIAYINIHRANRDIFYTGIYIYINPLSSSVYRKWGRGAL